MRDVAALFVKSGSVYNSLAGVDAWPAARDAMRYRGPHPVVCHPPCRAWGRYRHKSKHPLHEPLMALKAISFVRAFGGVLEHPSASSLWAHAALPRPGEPPDVFGGRSLFVQQVDWGHRALKPTWLYYCGCVPPQLPPVCVPTSTVENMWVGEREATPLAFAIWLVRFARSCVPP